MVNCSLFSFLYLLSPQQDCVLPTLGQGIFLGTDMVPTLP